MRLVLMGGSLRVASLNLRLLGHLRQELEANSRVLYFIHENVD